MPYVSVSMPNTMGMFNEVERLINLNRLLQTFMAVSLYKQGVIATELTSQDLFEFMEVNDFSFEMNQVNKLMIS